MEASNRSQHKKSERTGKRKSKLICQHFTKRKIQTRKHAMMMKMYNNPLTNDVCVQNSTKEKITQQSDTDEKTKVQDEPHYFENVYELSLIHI